MIMITTAWKYSKLSKDYYIIIYNKKKKKQKIEMKLMSRGIRTKMDFAVIFSLVRRVNYRHRDYAERSIWRTRVHCKQLKRKFMFINAWITCIMYIEGWNRCVKKKKRKKEKKGQNTSKLRACKKFTKAVYYIEQKKSRIRRKLTRK